LASPPALVLSGRASSTAPRPSRALAPPLAGRGRAVVIEATEPARWCADDLDGELYNGPPTAVVIELADFFIVLGFIVLGLGVGLEWVVRKLHQRHKPAGHAP
jgi:hypothetical protein